MCEILGSFLFPFYLFLICDAKLYKILPATGATKEENILFHFPITTDF